MSQLATKRSLQLGMPWSTAVSRLRKLILFDLLRRYGENVCHRCGGEISEPDDLTVEHKQDWLDVDPKLFWDLDNIAFSHYGCNAGANNGSKTHCKRGHPFSPENTRMKGRRRVCLACQRDFNREYMRRVRA